MYSYLRGIYRGRSPDTEDTILVEAGGIGYEVLVPPIVEHELSATCPLDDGLLLYVSAQSGRDQPWPQLFGFLTPRQKAFWQLLIGVPRIGGRLAARAMVAPVETIAGAIQQANRAYLDGLPGITLDGADRIIASLRKKVGPFVEPAAPQPAQPAPRTQAEEMREDAIALLMQMGLKRPEAQRGVDQLLASREDITSLQDLVTEYLRNGPGRLGGIV